MMRPSKRRNVPVENSEHKRRKRDAINQLAYAAALRISGRGTMTISSVRKMTLLLNSAVA